MVTYQFQNCQEYTDHGRLVHAGDEHLGQRRALIGQQLLVNSLHIHVNWSVVVHDRRGGCGLVFPHDPTKGTNEVPELNFLDRLVGWGNFPRW